MSFAKPVSSKVPSSDLKNVRKKEWFENIQEYAKRTIYPLKAVPINMGTK